MDELDAVYREIQVHDDNIRVIVEDPGVVPVLPRDSPCPFSKCACVLIDIKDDCTPQPTALASRQSLPQIQREESDAEEDDDCKLIRRYHRRLYHDDVSALIESLRLCLSHIAELHTHSDFLQEMNETLSCSIMRCHLSWLQWVVYVDRQYNLGQDYKGRLLDSKNKLNICTESGRKEWRELIRFDKTKQGDQTALAEGSSTESYIQERQEHFDRNWAVLHIFLVSSS